MLDTAQVHHMPKTSLPVTLEIVRGIPNRCDMPTMASRFGLLVGGRTLWKSLGYQTATAFHKAVARGTVPIPVFELPHRQGKFALAEDLDVWIDRLRGRVPPLPDDSTEAQPKPFSGQRENRED